MRCKRLTERQQERAHHDPKAPPPGFRPDPGAADALGASDGRPDRPIRTGFMTAAG